MFRSNLPVTEQAFFDRAAALERLSRVFARLAAGSPEWLAVIGPRKVGKTSLLLEATRRFHRAGLAFVILDVFDVMPVTLEVFRSLAGQILDVVLGEEVGVALSRLMREPREYRAALLSSERYRHLPRSLQTRVLELPERELDDSLVRDTIDLPEELAKNTGTKLLIAIDEFQELAGLGRRASMDPLPLMRSRWQRHNHVAYVISGSARSTLLRLVTEQHSPFFQHFAVLELGEFEKHDAIELLTKSAPEDRSITESLAERAVEIVGGHPFYLQILGEALTALTPPFDEHSLKESLQSILFSRTGRLALYFENMHRELVGKSTGLAATLEALAPGPKTMTEVAIIIGGSTGTANQYLQRLGDAIGLREDRKYELRDAVFAAWVRWRAPGGTAVPMRWIGDEAEAGVAEHLSKMGFDLVYASRGSRGAFDLLAIRGAAQLGVQVKRSPLPLRFSKTAWKGMVADAKRWHWRWIVSAVSEDGTITLLDPAKASKRKEVRLTQSAAIDNLLTWLD